MSGAQRDVGRAHTRARNHRSYWQGRGNRLVSGAQRDVGRARTRARNHRSYWQGRGNRLVSGAQRNVRSAQGRANRLMASTKARANHLLSQARSKLKQAQAQVARLLEQARQRGRMLVDNATGNLAAARRRQQTLIEQAKKRGAALVAKARRGVQLAQARVIQPLVRGLALRRIIELQVIKRRIAMLVGLMRISLANPRRLGIGGIRLADLRARVSRARKSPPSKPKPVVRRVSNPPSKPEKREPKPDPRPSRRAAAAIDAERQAAARAAQAEQERVARLKREAEAEARRKAAEEAARKTAIEAANQRAAAALEAERQAAAQAAQAEQERVAALKLNQQRQSAGTSVNAGSVKGTNGGNANIVASNLPISQSRSAANVQTSQAAQSVNIPGASIFAADLSDAELRAQIAAVGGNPNMDITQARAIIHNARAASVVRAQQAEQEQRQHAKANLPALFYKLPQGELEAGTNLDAHLQAQQAEMARRQQAIANLPGLFAQMPSGELEAGTNLLAMLQAQQAEKAQRQQAIANLPGLFAQMPQGELEAGTNILERMQKMALANSLSNWRSTDMANTAEAIARRESRWWQNAVIDTGNLWKKFDQSAGQWIRDNFSNTVQAYSNWMQNPNRTFEDTIYNALNITSLGILETTRKALSSATARLIYASILMSINDAIAHTSHHSLRVLTEKRFANRLSSAAEATFGLFNLVSLGALGDIRYGIKAKDWMRVAGGVFGLIPILGGVRGGHVIYKGGKSALRAVGTSLFTRGASGSISQALRGSWGDVLRFLNNQRVQDLRRVISITGVDFAQAQKLSALITHADEISDGIMSAREINQGIKNDDPMQMALGVFFGLTTSVGLATNKLTRPGLSYNELLRELKRNSLSEVEIVDFYRRTHGIETLDELRSAFLNPERFHDLTTSRGMLNKYVLKDLFINGYELDDLPKAKLDAMLEYFKTPQGREFWLNDTMYLGRQEDIYEFMRGNANLDGISLHSYDKYSGYLNEGLIDLVNSIGYQARGISTVMGAETSVTMNEYLYLMSKYQNIFDLDGSKLTIEGYSR